MKPDAEGTRPKPAVCRRLFADDSSEDQGLRDNMFNQITEQINRNLDDACKKYNFDFRSEVPLEGDWTWERITPDMDDSQAGAESIVTAPSSTAPSVIQGLGSECPKGPLTHPPPASDTQTSPQDEPTVPQN